MDNSHKISVLDFTNFPGARHLTDGDGSADEFFENFVKSTLDEAETNGDDVQLDFDGTYGYASSFISQLAMLISTNYDHEFIQNHLKPKSDDEPNLIDRFWTEYGKEYTE